MIGNCAELLDSVPEIESLFDRKTASDIQVLLDEYLSSDSSSESSSRETHKYGNNSNNKLGSAFRELVGSEGVNNDSPF